MESQYDAVNLICGAKTQSNPENAVGIMTMAGRVEVLVSLTSDIGKILSACHNIKIGGESNIIVALQVAQLALKNRQNRSQQQRIVIFVGSPINASQEKLIQTAKQLKKNNISVDIINFGEENSELLEAFIQAVDSKNTSHLLNIPPGPNILSDVILSSPILYGEGGAGPMSNDAYGGVDPNLDPELAMVIQVSLEEERQRQAAQAEKAQSQTTTDGTASTSDTKMDDTSVPTSAPAPAPAPATTTTPTSDAFMSDALDDEELELERAIALSMEEGNKRKEEEKASSTEATSTTASDEGADLDFINSVLSGLPGVDPSDQRIKDLLESMKKDEQKDKDKQ
eukprot:TRINITY_DN5486_c0_g1_i1.p1 TRINITY_DN5486_c0_g1~~TRINITY_DN5486_c0_g1_i1.p1  ORF type:complete len:372 (+),score=99.12 TRINITY_DN5486_c0_g1_i1:97-1116(+)